MNYALKYDKLEINYEQENDLDKLYINFINGKEHKGLFDNFFELNLIDVNVDEYSLGIPNIDYDVEFTIDSKKLVDVFSELNTFGSNLNIKCTESIVELNAQGDSTKIKVNIPVDDLNDYAIVEGEEIDIAFSLTHLCKMCLSIKMSSSITVSISGGLPMLLNYNLGDDSKVSFYIAPKVSEN